MNERFFSLKVVRSVKGARTNGRWEIVGEGAVINVFKFIFKNGVNKNLKTCLPSSMTLQRNYFSECVHGSSTQRSFYLHTGVCVCVSKKNKLSLHNCFQILNEPRRPRCFY